MPRIHRDTMAAMIRTIVAAVLFVPLTLTADDFFVKTCQHNGDGTAPTCVDEDGAAGAWAADPTFSNVPFGSGGGEVGPGDSLYLCGEIRGRLLTAQGGTETERLRIDFDCPGDPGSISGLTVVDEFEGSGPWNTTDTFVTPWNLLRDGVPLRSGIYGSLSKDEWQWNKLNGGDQKVYLGFDPTGHTVEISTINNAIQLDAGADFVDLISPRAYYINYGSSPIRIYSSNVRVFDPDIRYSRGGVDVRSTAHDVVVTNVNCIRVNACLDVNTDTPGAAGDDRPYNVEFIGGVIRGVVDDWKNLSSSFTYEIELQILNGAAGAIDEECIGSTDAGDNIAFRQLDIGYCGSWFVATLDESHRAVGYEVTDNVVHHVGRGIMTANSGFACFDDVDISRNRFFEVGDPLVNEHVLATGGDGSGCDLAFNDNYIDRAVQGLLVQQGANADYNRNVFTKMTSRGAGFPSYFVLFANANGDISGDNNTYFGNVAGAFSGRWRWKGQAATTTFSVFQSQAAPVDANSSLAATPRDLSQPRSTNAARSVSEARPAASSRSQAQRAP